ncbi:MAG: chemotaxis protein CheB, partial [Bdellovibrionia bacterium]
MSRKKQPSSLNRGLKAPPHKSVVRLVESRAKKLSPSARMGGSPPILTKTHPQSRQLFVQSGFPIVGIGASAGGLEAVTQLLAHLPIDTGMGFVLLQHLDPKQESLSVEIFSRSTRMKVT